MRGRRSRGRTTSPSKLCSSGPKEERSRAVADALIATRFGARREVRIFEFDGETGQIIDVRAYLDTAALAAAREAAGLAWQTAETL